jgi:hypothetical protein
MAQNLTNDDYEYLAVLVRDVLEALVPVRADVNSFSIVKEMGRDNVLYAGRPFGLDMKSREEL